MKVAMAATTGGELRLKNKMEIASTRKAHLKDAEHLSEAIAKGRQMEAKQSEVR